MYNRLISSTAYLYAPEAGMWIPSDSDAGKNSWNHYITVTAGTRGLTQAQQLGNAEEILGEIIAGEVNTEDDSNGNGGSRSGMFTHYKVTQNDLNCVDWVYAHPWSGSNVFWDNRTVLS